MPLSLHEAVAGGAQLKPGGGVNGVVDAPVAGMKATQQGAVTRYYILGS